MTHKPAPIFGTTLFDGDQAQKGYALNKMCYSFNNADNRNIFKADEEAYMQQYGLNEQQADAIRTRNVLGLIAAGGNVYYLAEFAGILGLDVQDLGADFYVFSGHKAYGPTGIGILYGKKGLLEKMPPYQGGGSMITEVLLEKSHYREPPYKFEAGTPHIAGAIGLGAAIDYLNQFNFDELKQHEQQLLNYVNKNLQTIQGLYLIGTAKEKAAILNFTVNDSRGIRIHGHDISDVLNTEAGVAVRAGQHCTMPLMQRFNVDSTVRASLAFYNNKEDIDALINGLQALKQLFK